MKPVLFLPLGLLLLLGPVRARGEEEKPAVTAYRYGASARANELLGNDAEALDLFDKSLAIKPDPVIFCNRAELKKKLKDLPGAIADYDAAIALKPSDAFAGMGPEDIYIPYGARGLLKHQLGDLDGAIADYSQVIRLKPTEALYYNNRGYALITKGDRAGAIADYSKAAALEPKTIKYRENLAGAKRAQGDLAGAIAEHDKIVALEPANPFRYYVRGDLKEYKGNFGGAIKDFSKCLELQPDVWGVYFQRGTARQAQGDLEGAFADYDKSVSGNPEHDDFAWAYREVALRLLKRGTPNEELAKIAAKGKAGFANDICLYLSGTMTEEDFIAKADQGSAEVMSGKRCVASYFVGMNRLAAGDKAAARKFLEQSVATKQADILEFVLARAELARLTKPK